MNANLFYAAQVEQARREQERRQAAEWQLARSCASTRPGRGRWLRESQRLGLLAWMIGCFSERARAPEYAAQ